MIHFLLRHMDAGPNHGPRHHMARYRLNQEIRRAVWAALVEAHALPSASAKLELATRPVKRVVTFTRFYGGRVREMDNGNFTASCKAVLDALKCGDRGEGLIYDDRPEWVTDVYQQRKSVKHAGLMLVEVGGSVGTGVPPADCAGADHEPAARRDVERRKADRGHRDHGGVR